jgi:hypothetical protein
MRRTTGSAKNCRDRANGIPKRSNLLNGVSASGASKSRGILEHVDETPPTPLGTVDRAVSFVQNLPRDAIAWLLGLAALGFASARVLVASGGDAETLKYLVQSLDVKALILATLLPFTSTVLTWLFIVSLLVSTSWGVEPKRTIRSRITENWITIVLLLLAVFFTMPLGWLVGNTLAFLIIAVMGLIGWAGRKWCGPLYNRILSLLGTLIAGVGLIVLIVAPFWLAGIWLPEENLTLRHGSDKGYVISSDEGWTKYMDEDKEIQIVPSSSVVKRKPNETQAWYYQTLFRLLVHQLRQHGLRAPEYAANSGTHRSELVTAGLSTWEWLPVRNPDIDNAGCITGYNAKSLGAVPIPLRRP